MRPAMIVAALATFAGLSLPAVHADAATRYRVRCLDCAYQQAHGSTLLPAKISNANQVVANDAVTGQGYLLANGMIVATPVMPGFASSTADGVNAAGHVVGTQYTALGLGEAYLWDGTAVTMLGTLPGATGSSAAAVNDVDQVTGASGSTGFLYGGGVMTAIPPLPGQGISWGTGINASGHVVGASLSGGIYGDPDAWVYAAGRTYALSSRFVASWGMAINDLDQTAGQVDSYAATWDSAGRLRFLNSLPGFSTGLARGINIHGVVVGTLAANNSAAYPLVAFVYAQGKVKNMNSLIVGGAASGWILNEAHGVNDAGVIVGRGSLNGEAHAFVAWPVER